MSLSRTSLDPKVPIITRNGRYYTLGSLLLTVLVVIPIWGISFLPLVDLPVHQARVHILYVYSSNTFFQNIFELILEPLPNVGMDLMMLGLQSIMPLGSAMKVMITFTVIVFVWGANHLFQTFAPERRWLLLLSPLLVYHTFFIYGFLNYTLGLGFFFLTFTYWYRHSVSATTREALTGWITFAVFSTACYLTHLSSYAFLMIAVGSVILINLRKQILSEQLLNKRSIIASTGLLVPLVLFVLFMGGSGTNAGYQISDLRSKIASVFAMVTSYDVTFDLILIGCFTLVLSIALLTGGKRRIDQTAATLAFVFFGCFLLSPAMLFTSHMADTRFIPVATVFALSSIGFVHVTKIVRYCAAAVVVLLMFRASMIVREWVDLSPKLKEQYDLAKVVPAGSHIKVLYYPELIALQKQERPFQHLLSYLIAEKDLITSDFIAKRGQQPIVYRRPPKELELHITDQLDETLLSEIEREYDHIWAYRLSSDHLKILNERYTLLRANQEARLYRLR